MHIRGLPPTARRQRGACIDSSAPTWRGLSGRAASWCRKRVRAPLWRGLLGRAPLWRGPLGRAPLRRRPNSPAPTCATSVTAHHRGAANTHVGRRGAPFGARRRRGTARTALCLHGANSVAECHCGAAKIHVRHPGAFLREERHRSAAQPALRRRGASSVTRHHRGVVNVHVRRRGVTFRAERHRAPASPWCVLEANTRGTMAGSAPGAPPPTVAPRAEVTGHRRTSPSRSGTIVVPFSRSRAVTVHVS